MRKFHTVFMRGGTSKGCMFRREDLPQDRAEWDSIFLQAMGCPDPKQIDGLGGTVSSNNKIVIVWKSEEENVDIEYLVGQVIVGKKQVDYKSNCGNMTAAAAPFAVEEGMVEIVEPVTNVRMKNLNTNKYINVTVPIDPETHTFSQDGDCHIAGVDGTAAELKVDFLNPAGSKTGKLLPTGNPKDTIEVEGKTYEYSFVDAANPVMFVHPEDFGVTGTETPAQFNARPDVEEIKRKLEVIRGTGAIILGFAKDLEDARVNSQTLPKLAFARKPVDYTAGSGKEIKAENIDLVGRLFSMNMKMIDAYMGTGAICTVTAANTPGTIVNEIVCGEGKHPDNHAEHIRIGHPWGIMDAYADLKDNPDGTHTVLSGNLDRTARRIMEGYVYVRE